MGLSTTELTQIKETLAAGKKPRVMFTDSAGQIAGQIGHVVQLDDPSIQEDWILVKFGADILPFPPADLSMAPRGAATKKAPAAAEPAASVKPAKPAPPEPEFKVIREPVPAARKEKAPPPPAVIQEKIVTEPESAPPAPRKPTTAKAAKAKPLPSFTVTVAYAEGEWTVGAVQGAKTLAKPYVIKPADALKMVSMLDVAGVQEAVETIMSAERAQTLAVAEKLRAELAELEAKLADLGA